MSIISVKFESNVLERVTDFKIIIPPTCDPKTSKVLYLLHGYWGDASNWVLKGNAVEMALKYNVIILMPSAYNSFYLNHEHGERYYDYLAKEVIEEAKRLFNLGGPWYIAGLSMGGYGALNLGLRDDNFKAIGTFSGALDITPRSYLKETHPHMAYVLDSIKEEDYVVNIFKARKTKVPFIYQYCGKTDFLYEVNLAYQDVLKNGAEKYVFKTDERAHEWSAWRDCLDDFLAMITKED